jgi:hypothetical protein
MSEPMFGSGQTATLERPDAAEAAQEPTDNRKLLLVVGGIVVALVVLAGAFFLMFSGGSPEDEAAGLVVVPVAPADAGAVAAPAAPKPVIQPAKTNVSSRDPFTPLFPPKEESTTANGSQTTTDPNAADPNAAAPTVPNTTEPTTTVTPVELAVSKIDTKKGVASLSVDGTKYANQKVGDSFGTYYTLYSIFNSQCVGVLFGDVSQPVCLGKPASVTP